MAKQIQNNFSAGEVSRQASARYDLDIYRNGAEALENLFVMVEGGVVRASGTRHIALTRAVAPDARLIPFKKSNEDSVVIEMTPGFMRYVDSATRRFLPNAIGNPITTTFPMSVAQLESLYWFQSADVIFFTCRTGDLPPHALRRFSDASWSLVDYDLRGGPFLAENTTETQFSASGVAGVVTVTANARFAPDDVGARVRFWTDLGAVPFQKWEPEEDLTAGQDREYNGRVYTAFGAGKCSRQPPVHERSSPSFQGIPDGGGFISWEYRHDLSGIGRITQYLTVSSVRVQVEERLPALTTRKWAEQFFSDRRGWPFCGAIFQSRLFFAGSPRHPDTLWASRIDGYNTFYVDFKQSSGNGEVLDDHAIVRTLNDGEVNRIGWMLPGEQLICGTAGGIVRVTGPSLDEPMTPYGAAARRPEEPPGAAYDVTALRAGASIVYAAVGSRDVIALDPSDFSFLTLTARARHALIAPPAEFAWLRQDRRLFMRLYDGRLYCCTFDKEQRVIAWTQVILGGSLNGRAPFVRAICAAPDENGRDALWLVAHRTVGGVFQASIEVMEADFDGDLHRAENAVMADASVVVRNWNADPAQVLTVEADGGPTEISRGDAATLTASGFAFDAGWVGRRIMFRERVAARAWQSSPARAIVRITAQAGATASGVFEIDFPLEFGGDETLEWAFMQSHIDGLDHLNGETVGVYADGADVGDFIVSGGRVTLMDDAGDEILFADACAGLRKTWRGRSLPLLAPRPDGVSKGDPIRVSRVYAHLLDCHAERSTVAAVVDGRVGAPEPLAPRDDRDLMTLPTGLRTGERRVPVTAARGRAVQVEFGGDGMGPAAVLSVGVMEGE